MIIGIALLAVVGAIVFVVVRRSPARAGLVADGGQQAAEPHAARNVVQYLGLYGLLVVAAVGLSGLLGQILQQDTLVSDDAALARAIAFTVVGVPLYAGLAWWSRRLFVRDPGEARSAGWALYASSSCLTSLIVLMVSFYAVLAWLTDLERYDSAALARTVVWGTVFAVHIWLDTRLTPASHAETHTLAGSVLGLVTSACGITLVVAATVDALWRIWAATGMVFAGDEPLLRGLVLLAVGVPVWVLYWVSRARVAAARDALWVAYVLLVGVGGGLFTALVAGSIAIYDTLVWFFGEAWEPTASLHFQSLPWALGAALAGAGIWYYHHAVLAGHAAGKRTEIVRLYEYLMAGAGLVAAAVGLSTLLVSLIEAVTDSSVLIGGSVVNTVLAALTLLAVGGPVWALYWRRIQGAWRSEPGVEQASPTRRIYLVLLFGVAGVAAVVALLVGVYIVVNDALVGAVDLGTLRSIRIPLGIIVSAGVISAYHWTVYRSDRAAARELAIREAAAGGTSGAEGRRPHFVLLVGPREADLVSAVARETGSTVQAWSADVVAPCPPTVPVEWSVEAIVEAVQKAHADEVLVVAETDGVHAIAIHRR